MPYAVSFASPHQAQLAAAFIGEVVGGPGGGPDLFDDDVFDAGDFEQLGLDGFGVAAGAVDELKTDARAPVKNQPQNPCSAQCRTVTGSRS